MHKWAPNHAIDTDALSACLAMSHYDESLKFSSPKLEKLIPGSGGKLEGKEAVRSYWVKALSAQPELHFELIAVLKGIQSVVIHYRGVGGKLCAEFFMFSGNGMVVESHAHGESAMIIDVLTLILVLLLRGRLELDGTKY